MVLLCCLLFVVIWGFGWRVVVFMCVSECVF